MWTNHTLKVIGIQLSTQEKIACSKHQFENTILIPFELMFWEQTRMWHSNWCPHFPRVFLDMSTPRGERRQRKQTSTTPSRHQEDIHNLLQSPASDENTQRETDENSALAYILVAHVPVRSLSVRYHLPGDDPVTPDIWSRSEFPVGDRLWSRPPHRDFTSLRGRKK